MKNFVHQNQNNATDSQMHQTVELNDDMGLDCSGQGECQPNIEPSDTDKMQTFLVRANKNKKRKMK